jgi:SAM-dependent methyltransferase
MDYYAIAKKASSQIAGHPGLEYLKSICKPKLKILDVGCGEGTRLNTLLSPKSRGWGIDPSSKAIALAKTHYPRHYFQIGVGEKLPYASNSFDLIYSAFAIEHCQDPQLFIDEMIRVTKIGGQLVILAPNYGAPNRRSPVSTESPLNKFFEGLIKDLFPPPSLSWSEVAPASKYTQIDSDTTFEPYLLSLKRYLTLNHLTIQQCSSLWSLEPESKEFRKLVIKKLGQFGTWPFSMWGPQLFIVSKKLFKPQFQSQ